MPAGKESVSYGDRNSGGGAHVRRDGEDVASQRMQRTRNLEETGRHGA